MTVGDLLDQMTCLRDADKIDKAIRRVYAEVDHWMWAERLDDCDLLCELARPEREGLTLCVAILSITLPVKSKLPQRPVLYDRCSKALEARGEDPSETLHGLA